MNKTNPFILNGVQFTIGTDPEFMAYDITRGSVVSAIPILKQGKDNRISLAENGAYNIYHDNTMMECNIPPANSVGEFTGNLRKLFFHAKKHLGANYDILAQASHSFTNDECAHDAAREFGCNPELCAWSYQSITPPEGAALSTFRSAGGHIHIGRSDFKQYEEGDDVYLMSYESKTLTIRVLDAVVGLTAAYLDNDPTSAPRKAIYGEAGRYRITPYGVEYRTLGNFWLSSPTLSGIIAECVIEAVRICESGNGEALLTKYFAGKGENDVEVYAGLIKAVNTNNKAFAATYLPKILPAELWAKVKAASQIVPAAISIGWALADYKPESNGVKLTAKTKKGESKRGKKVAVAGFGG